MLISVFARLTLEWEAAARSGWLTTDPCFEVFENIALSGDVVLQAMAHTIKNFLGSRPQPVGMAIDNLGATPIDDARFDAATSHPPRSHETGWACANDEAACVVLA